MPDPAASTDPSPSATGEMRGDAVAFPDIA